MIKKPALYGITYSNRNFADPYYWGKNQFNSSFPAALACYMRDKKVPAVYLSLTSECKVNVSEIAIEKMFGTELPNSEIFFAFETAYEPFRDFLEDNLPPIDLVVKDKEQQFIRPLEIKLTTLPDDSTSN
ncbi:MAG TPA: HindVP family restriction endonuclease, partial [Candidatus Hydrogenedentes bacterium]|nr:HindVP family restriction endonuclease [Candidatus Hydrogenedentota bacterium]